MEDPHSLKSNEMAQCSFAPQQPLVCDTFKNCEGLSRVAFMDGNGVVMLGKVISCERKEEGGAWFVTLSRIARDCRVWLSWTEMELSCLARSFLASARRKEVPVARRSEGRVP